MTKKNTNLSKTVGSSLNVIIGMTGKLIPKVTKKRHFITFTVW